MRNIRYYILREYVCPRCGSKVEITNDLHSRMCKCTVCKWKGYHPDEKKPTPQERLMTKKPHKYITLKEKLEQKGFQVETIKV